MNYIQKLNDKISRLDTQRAVAYDAVQDLKQYLQSSKFRCGNELDGYVNIQDVMNRLAQINLTNQL